MRFDMADADMPAIDALIAGDPLAFTGEMNRGLARGLGADFDVGPGDAAAPAGAEHFQDGLLGGESAGQMLDVTLGIAGGIGLFSGCVDAVQKMFSVLIDHAPNARGFDNINSVTDNWHGRDRIGPVVGFPKPLR